MAEVNNVFMIPDGPYNQPSAPRVENSMPQSEQPTHEQGPLFERSPATRAEYAPEIMFLGRLGAEHAQARRSVVSDEDVQRQKKLIDNESKLGRFELAPAPFGTERRFSYDHQFREWIYAQLSRNPADQQTIRYQLQPDHVLKIVDFYDHTDGQKHIAWAPLHGRELDNFQRIALLHYQRVSRELYGVEPIRFDASIQEASEELLNQHAKAGQQVIHQVTTDPQTFSERRKQRINQEADYLQGMLDSLHDEMEREATEGRSELDAAPIDYEFEDVTTYVERRAAEEQEKHKTDFGLAA